jgi:hypothetical protein
MTTDKREFFNNLFDQISSPIYLTKRTDDVQTEIKYNYVVINTPSHIVARATQTDFIDFLKKVKDNCKQQLENSNLNIDLIYYLWFEEPGELCFNLINSNHKELPFGCRLQFTDNEGEIIEQYLKSEYHDRVVPSGELQICETAEDFAEADRLEKEIQENFILTVYQERIRRPNKVD